MRSTVMAKELLSRFWLIYMLSAPLNIDKWFLECCLSVCLSSAWTAGWILFIFSILEFIYHRSMPGEYEHSSSTNMDSSDRPPQINRFSWKQFKQFWLLKFTETISLHKILYAVPSEKKTICTLGAQTWNVNCVKSCSTDTDQNLITYIGNGPKF